LSDSQNLRDSILNSLPDAVIALDGEARVIYCNAAAGPYIVDNGVVLTEFPSGRRLKLESREPRTREVRVKTTRSSDSVWIQLTSQPLPAEGTLLRIVNVTERRKREAALESSDRLLDVIYRGNLAGIIHSSVEGVIIDCNDAIVRMLGYVSRDELKSVRANQLYCDPSQRSRMLELLDAPQGVSEFELCLRRRDGSACWAVVNVSLLDPAPGAVGATFVSTIVEITERKKWEETLRQNEQRFAAFMNHLPGIAFIKDLEGRYVYYNEASQRLFGKPPEAFIGHTDRELWPPEPAAQYQSNDAKVVLSKAPIEATEIVPHPDGQHTWLIYKFPIIENDKVSFVGGVGIDVTERRTLEDQLAQARKMEALGRLAGGVAHDFNNLLTVISGYGQLALEGVETATSAKLTIWLQEILNSSRRAAALTGQLLAFSRKQPVQTHLFDLSVLLRDMETLLQRMVGELVELNIDCTDCERPCVVQTDPHQMEQVIMNLAVNARDAMPLGGILDITCGIAAHPPDRPTLANGAAFIEVRDTGIGMDEKVKAHMFEPFFTSKTTGKGTGLGLSTVYGVVSQAGGEIEVVSEPGEGTVFRIYLPLAIGNVEVTPAPVSIPTGRETILLAEDEPSLNTLAQTILRRLGYTVFAAENGPAALALWEETAGRIDLLLTDVIMPQMSGGELAHRLREKNPRLKVLFMSGYTDDMIASHGVMAGETQFLQKPFTSEKLGSMVRAVLDA